MVLAVVLAAGVSGCGKAGARRSPSLDRVPLAKGTRIVAHARSCDHGANAYCAVQAVIVGAGYRSSAALLAGEEEHLRALGWTVTRPRSARRTRPGTACGSAWHWPPTTCRAWISARSSAVR
jgi:hypothetical protein